MKKIIAIVAFVSLLTSVSCARKNCPAYSSATQVTLSAVVNV